MNVLELIQDWVPTFFSVLFVVATYWIVKYLMDKQSNSGSFSIIRTIILFSIALIGFIFIILSIPMDEGIKGQITSLFGIVISAGLALSSATFIGNGLAGVMLRAVNSYKAGDFIEVGGVLGRVSEKGLLHTEIQTESRDLVTLPNLHLATNPVRVIRASGTFVNAAVSLGYDVNQHKIKEALLKASANAGLEDSFVHITELGDYSVVYKVFGLLKDAKTMISAKSRLYGCMLDALHESDIEIVSPSFMNQRQVGEAIFIPKKVRKHEVVEDNEKVAQKVFDKAEEAETIEKRTEFIDNIKAEIKTCQEDLPKLESESDILAMKNRISKLEEKRDVIQARLDAKMLDLKNKE